MMFYLRFALNSLISRARQYRSLFSVCAVGVCIMLSVLMVTDGMLVSMNEKARQYYGGDFQLLGGLHLVHPASESVRVVEALKSVLPAKAAVSMRYNYDARNESYYFEGASVRQRVIQGVDFESEKALFSKFTFIEGNAVSNDSGDTVILSEPIAKKLGVHIGDEITLFISTNDGYKNTVPLEVTGIFQDSSIFGMYTSYVDIRGLMKALDLPELVVNKICVYYTEGDLTHSELQKIQNGLEKLIPMFPLSNNKNDFYDAIKHSEEPLYGIVPLDANVSDLRLLVQALRGIVLIIVVLLVIIISVGISSTFRVIVMKRTVESGTFRALGMKPAGLMGVYFTEVLLLLLSGCISGMFASFIVVKVASTFNLSFISGFDMFLTGGCLAPVFVFSEVIFLIGVILVTTLGAVLFTLRKLIHISPVGAIAATV